MSSVVRAVRPDWLGGVLECQGPVIFFTAEEDWDELHRRLAAILNREEARFSELDDLHLLAMPDEDPLLCAAAGDGVVRATPLFDRFQAAAAAIRPALIIIEAVAGVFGGDEIKRAQVRQFIGLLRRLAIKSGAAVLLLAHPSQAGLASGSGTSGSTHWNNGVRSRLYFALAKTNGDGDADVRELSVMKSNYGPSGETVRVRWDRGVFAPVPTPSPIERAAAEADIDRVFLSCLEIKTVQGITVGPNTGKNYAPSVFEDMPQANGIKSRAFKQAMERLLVTGKIKVETTGSNSRKRSHLARGGP